MSHRIVIPKSEKIIKQEQLQTKLATLAKKKEQGKLTLEDVDEKLDMIIKILQDLMPPK